MRRFWISLSILLIPAVYGTGCYYDDHHHFDDTEIVRYQNFTEFYVDNYIDGRFVGTVPPDGDLEVEGDFEGWHTFESVAEDEILVWGPTDFRIRDGEVFIIDLVADGSFKTHTATKSTGSPVVTEP